MSRRGRGTVGGAFAGDGAAGGAGGIGSFPGGLRGAGRERTSRHTAPIARSAPGLRLG
ncbi:hypothetical protein SFR_2906 [Streptomyces sp. FR-008]|nr:hypothetical protein SFR_2906 [Streptomyces sp. FR-008]